MVDSKRPLPFVRLAYELNRTPTGKRTATPVKKAARYFAYANDREAERRGEQRSHWYGPDGSKHEHEAVLAWATAGAKAHRYTFQALLSLPEGRLSAEDFTRAMREGKYIDDFRLMSHDDTKYSHAHVLFFGDSRLEKVQFSDWYERIRQSLAALEEATLQAEDQRPDEDLTQQQSCLHTGEQTIHGGLDLI
jgi:hypothetical protein